MILLKNHLFNANQIKIQYETKQKPNNRSNDTFLYVVF